MTKDPFGVQPRPRTGQRLPVTGDPSIAEHVSNCKKLAQSIWVDHPPQVANIDFLREYRYETLGRYGEAIDGRCLFQETQSGKNATAKRLKAVLAQEAQAQGHTPNPFQVLIVTIKKRMSIRGFLRSVLVQMEDDFTKKADGTRKSRDDRDIETLEERIAEWAVKLGVELLIIDEVQRLKAHLSDAQDVTEQFQTMLDRGVVPLVLLGTEEAKERFEPNEELSARLGTPLELPPMSCEDEDSAEMFQDFLKGFDQELKKERVFSNLSKLDQEAIAIPLREISGGHVGRVARMIHEATAIAVRRGAKFIEPYDLSIATRTYAVRNKWIAYDPFSKSISDA